MNRASMQHWCASVLLLGVLHDSLAAEECDLANNAALIYWKAKADWGELFHPGFDDKLRESLVNPLTTPLDAATSKALVRYAPLLKSLHVGAQMRQCEWGLRLDDGPLTLASHIESFNYAVCILIVRARLEFHEDHPSAALADLRDALHVAQHLGSDHFMTGLYIQTYFDRWIFEVLAENLDRCSRSELEALRKDLTELPLPESARARLLVDKKSCLEWLAGSIEHDDETVLRTKLLELGNPRSEDPGDPVRVLVAKVMASRAAGSLKGSLVEIARLYDDQIELAQMPPEKLATAQAAFVQRVLSSGPLARLYWCTSVGGTDMGSTFERLRDAELRLEISRAMVRASLGLVLSGRAALDQVPDPVSGKPFELVERPDGFELRSSVKIGEQAPKLTFKAKLP